MVSSTRSLRSNQAIVAFLGSLPFLIVTTERVTQGKDVTDTNSEVHKIRDILVSCLLIPYSAAEGQSKDRFELFSPNGQSNI